MNHMMELFQQLLQEYGPLMWLYVLIPFLLGFLLARLLVVPVLRKERKHAEDLMELFKQAEAQKQEAEKAAGQLQTELATCKSRMESKAQLAAVWQQEAEGCEVKLSESEQELNRLNKLLNEKQERLYELLRQVEQRDKQLAELEKRLSNLSEENRQLLSQLSTEQIALEQIAQMQSTLNAALQRIGELENHLPKGETQTTEAPVLKEVFVEPAQTGEASGLETELAPSAKELLPEDDVERAKAAIKTAIGKKIPHVTAKNRDDLSRIEGIGPFLEAKLNELGIYAFRQIAALDEELVEALTKAIGFIPGRIQKDRWVEQAARLAKPVETKKKKSARAKTAKSNVRPQRDDLKLIEGIGPKIEEVLNKAGIKTWRELAKQEVEQLRTILASAGKRFTMHQPDSWPEQARLAAEGKWKELKELQDRL